MGACLRNPVLRRLPGLAAMLSSVALVGMTAAPSPALAASPPIIIKAFGVASIPLGGSTSLTFIIQNNNASTALHGVGFTDNLPSGLVVSAPNGLSGSCGGGTIAAEEGGSTVSLSGATLAGSTQCNFSINVLGTSGGLKNNTTGNVTSIEGGTGGTASASVKVEAPPQLETSFGPAAIAPGSTSGLSFAIANPAGNIDPLSGVAFSDILPLGITVPNASAGVCGGTVTLISPRTITMSGATISTNCLFTVTTTGGSAGHFTDTTSEVSSTNGGVGSPSSAVLDVGSAPSVSESFAAPSVPLGGETRLTLLIANLANSAAIAGVGFADLLPPGLRLAPDPAPVNGCGGTLTASGGGASFSLGGASIEGLGSCAVTVAVQGAAPGNQENVVSANSNGGLPSGVARASLTVIGPPTIAVSSPASGASYSLGQQVAASYACTEAPSGPGIGSCSGTVANGAPIDTSTAGLHSFTVNAASSDGLTSSTTFTYTVQPAAKVSSPPQRKVTPPSNHFKVIGHHAAASGVVTLDVKVPGPGSVTVLQRTGRAGALFGGARATSHNATVLRIKLRPTARGKRLLTRGARSTHVTLRVTYAPLGGSPRTVEIALAL